MAVDKSLISGSTTLLILSLLEEKDMYGYEMIDTLRQKSQNVFELKARKTTALSYINTMRWYKSLKTNPAYCPNTVPPGRESGIPVLSYNTAKIPAAGRCPAPAGG